MNFNFSKENLITLNEREIRLKEEPVAKSERVVLVVVK